MDSNSTGKVTNTLSKRQKIEVLELKDGWARISKYYDGEVEGMSGEVARWVSAEYISPTRPALEEKSEINSPLAEAIKYSDDLEENKHTLISVSNELISSGTCTLSDFKKVGGWLKSVNYKPKSVYYTLCGGTKNSNRIYLNTETREIFK